uniref:Uncharacterized protein n=1 Tax=Anguilla anguilla TaxID=7936 RepID=A0A0E9WQU5_ANGAN
MQKIRRNKAMTVYLSWLNTDEGGEMLPQLRSFPQLKPSKWRKTDVHNNQRNIQKTASHSFCRQLCRTVLGQGTNKSKIHCRRHRHRQYWTLSQSAGKMG